jgi:hypothetical protein
METMGAVETQQEYVTIIVPRDDWVRLSTKVSLMVEVLASICGSLQMTPFGGMIPPETVEQIQRVNEL